MTQKIVDGVRRHSREVNGTKLDGKNVLNGSCCVYVLCNSERRPARLDDCGGTGPGTGHESKTCKLSQFAIVCRNKLDRNRHVIEQKL